MPLRQLFYTSCRSGLRGSVGFQFNAVTPGIDAGLLREVEDLCRYQPPPSAPPEPTVEALAGFPISLSFTFLHEGGAALCRSVYLGKDYSGRYGNFFAHTLLSDRPEADLTGLLPIELWGSPVWVCRQSPVTELASLERAEPGGLTRQRVAGFLRAEGRIAHLPAVLAAVLEALAPGGRQVILVEEETGAVANWIAAVCYSLPRTIAIRLSFTTYTLRPRYAPHLIVGITPDADFDFSPAEMGDQYRVFDFPGCRFSPAAPGSYGTIAAQLWQAGPPEIFNDLDAFARRLGADGDPAELHAAAGLFALGRDIALDAGGIREAARWAGTRGTTLPGQAWSFLARGLDRAGDPLSLREGADLARAASGLGGPLAELFTRRYLERVLAELVAPDPDPYLWEIGKDGRAPGPLSEETGSWLRDVLDARLHEIGDARRAVLALELMSALDVRPSDGALGRLGAEVLGPAVVHGPDDALARALATPAGARAWEGVLDFLDRMAGSGDLGALVDGLAGPLARWVRDADPERFPSLALAAGIARARSHPTQRLAVLDRILSARDAGAPAGDAGLDDLVSLLWADRPPSAEEGVSLLQILPDDLEATGLPHLLASSLVRASRIDRHSLRLASALATHACFASLAPGDLAVIEAVCHGDRFRRGRPPSPAIELATRLFARADALPEGVHGWLIGGLCRWLIGLPPSSHEEALRPLWPPGSRALRETYPAEMVELLADRTACGPVCAARIFVVWERLDRVRAGGGAPLLKAALPVALRTWPKSALEAVTSALGDIDPPSVPGWETWRDAHLPAGVLSRLRRRR